MGRNMMFTAAQKLACAKRELTMRRRVYPNWVNQGRMTQEEANHEVAVMADIVEDYRAKAEPSLFTEKT